MTNSFSAEGEERADELLGAVRELTPKFRARAEEAERERELPAASAAEMIDAGLARALVPKRWGGTEIDLDTWIDVVIEVAEADASHGWCANLMIHEPQMLAAFPEEGQAAIWADGPDVSVAGSIIPVCEIKESDGGYRVSGKSPFSSGVGHSSWVWVAGMVHDSRGGHNWTLFLIPPDQFEILDTWHTVGMSGTGSNTIVTEDVFVPEGHTLALREMVEGTAPGASLHDNRIYRLPFGSYAQVGFAAAMLGSARGAAARFRQSAAERKTMNGARMAELSNVQVKLARAEADLDGAELLLRRAIAATRDLDRLTLDVRARTLRDCSRAAELVTGAIDVVIGLSGTAAYGTSNPLQRAWRDIHFASCHISLNPEINLGYWGGTQLGVDRPSNMAIY